MIDAYLGLGSNLGDRARVLRAALGAVAQLPATALVAESPVYETPPMGPQDQGPYLNCAAHIRTGLAAEALIESLQQIERRLGRADAADRIKWGPREIDIDLLLFGDAVIDRPGLTVPHPGMHQRWFVLKPLADIAPGVRHPSLGRTATQLLIDIEAAAVQEAQP